MDTIKHEAFYLVGRDMLNSLERQQYVDWAVSLLQRNIESENIIILAGLDRASKDEKQNYFEKVLENLSIIVPNDFDNIMESLFEILIWKIHSGELETIETLNLIRDIVYSQHSENYPQFMYLLEDIDLLNEDYSISTNITKNNIEEFIIREFELWLKARKKGINNITQLAYCRKCGHIAKPELKLKKNFFSSVKRYYCYECNSTDLLYATDQSVRIRIVENWES